MANVFISYKKEDFSSAERIVTALRNEGLSVWWDDHLTAKESWDATIEKEIEAAAAVVVLWTPRSVSSEWVRTEAHYAAERGKLIPVCLEKCSIPIAFLLRQTIQLSGWQGEGDHRQWRKLLTWILDLQSTRAGAPSAQDFADTHNRLRKALGHLPSGEAIVDGAFVNAATPAGTVFRDSDQLPVMRIIPRGSFMLGAQATDPDRSAVEGPQRRVEIPEPFAMSVYPVLVAEYLHVMGQLPTAGPPGDTSSGLRKFFASKSSQSTPTTAVFVDAAPITWISFDDATRFVTKVSEVSGERYRVPSESEWEYACRGGSQTRYSFGDTITPTMAHFSAAAGPIEAGRYVPNAFGLYDMHGNVREWTADLWQESYDSTPLDGSPMIEGHSSMRVVRGGAWCDDATLLRSAARMRATQFGRSNLIGMRVARALRH